MDSTKLREILEKSTEQLNNKRQLDQAYINGVNDGYQQAFEYIMGQIQKAEEQEKKDKESK